MLLHLKQQLTKNKQLLKFQIVYSMLSLLY